ncbi:MAG: DHA2 family efflux MFS transporter permease subunit [Chloroflexi bacterium]|nr:DHA2 family efflux MFS transporter permease subunit [Chloroflexota bacterium]
MATQPVAAAQTRIDYAAILTGRRKAIILIGVLLSLFLAALDQTIVATALPRIVADLQGIDLLAWVTTAYLLTSTTMVPIYGKLSDIYGRKIVLLFGIVIFLTGSVMCGFASNMISLVIFRGIQGFGAAALTSTAFAILADLFVPTERARYQGIFAATFGLSSVVGPYVGGLLTDTVGWHWVFFVNLPLGILALVFIISQMPKLDSGIVTKVDFLGAALLMVAVVPLLLGLTLDKTAYPWTSPLILGLFAISLVSLVLFLLVEQRVQGPIIPLYLFRIRIFTLVSIASVLIGAAFFAAVLFLSLYLVNVLGVSATAAGTALIPLTLSLVVSSIVSSLIVQRTGKYKALVLIGIVIMTGGFWWLSTMGVNTTLNEVRIRMMVIGLGLGPTLPILTLALQNAVPFKDIGAATASRQFFQQLGQAVGSAVFGVILTSTLTTAMTTNLAPVTAQLPPQMAAQFDPNALRNGSGGGVAAAGADQPIEQRIETGIKQQFATQRDLLTRAVRDNDPVAVQAILTNPQTPDQLKSTLQAGGIAAALDVQIAAQKAAIAAALRSGKPEALQQLQADPRLPQPLKQNLAQIPPQMLSDPKAVESAITTINTAIDNQKPALVASVTAQALQEINTTLDAAQEQALVQGRDIGHQVGDAIKRAFSNSVTDIYRYAIPLAVLAFLLLLFMPEWPLRGSNSPAPPVAFE